MNKKFTEKRVTEKRVNHVPTNINAGRINMNTGSLHCRGTNISATDTLDIAARDAKFEGVKNEHTKETYTVDHHSPTRQTQLASHYQPRGNGSSMANLGADLLGGLVRTGLATTGPVGAKFGVVAGNALTEIIKAATSNEQTLPSTPSPVSRWNTKVNTVLTGFLISPQAETSEIIAKLLEANAELNAKVTQLNDANQELKRMLKNEQFLRALAKGNKQPARLFQSQHQTKVYIQRNEQTKHASKCTPRFNHRITVVRRHSCPF